MIIIYATMDSKEPVSPEAMQVCVDFQNESLSAGRPTRLSRPT
jgi:hypothetical protein